MKPRLSRLRFLTATRRVWCIAWLFAAASTAAATPDALSFGVVPHRSALLTARYWNPILNYVEKKTGILLQLEVSKSVAAHAQAIDRGDYDLTQSMLIFRSKAQKQNYRVILRPQGGPIRSQLVVLESSPLRSVIELQGREVAFPARSGMVAYGVPMDFLLHRNIAVTPLFAGNQEGVLGQLRAGEAPAAAVSSQVSEAYSLREGVKFRLLWESPPYHDLPIATHPRVPESLSRPIQNALAGMAGDPEGLNALEVAASAIGQKPPYGFIKAVTGDYARHAEFFRNSLVKEME
jgi:phosphonate transport system substrate-binding protein